MAQRKPRIGVTAPEKGGRLLWKFTKFMVTLSGGVPQRITAASGVSMSDYDGFIISGGGDINPKRYGEPLAILNMSFDDARDMLEYDIIHYALAAKKPVLGICRGMQMMNVALGGTLYQEAKDVLEDFLPNNSMISKIIGRRRITINPETTLYHIMGGDTHYRVNSIHHQAVKDVATELRIASKEENGLVQAIEHRQSTDGIFYIGVQWHPELMPHANHARRLFRAFISSTNI